MPVNPTVGRSLAEVQPVEKTDITMRVLARIREMLERDILRAGSKMPTEQEMTKALRISRPSLRQAYKVLNVLGILRAVPGDGTYISDAPSRILATPFTFMMLTKKIDLQDVFGLRITLEGELASLAAERATSEELSYLEQQIYVMSTSLRDRKRYLQAEYEFHNFISRAAHNPLILEIVLIISELLWEVRREVGMGNPEIKKDLQMHSKILEKIRGRDAEGARQAMHFHLKKTLEIAQRMGVVQVRKASSMAS